MNDQPRQHLFRSALRRQLPWIAVTAVLFAAAGGAYSVTRDASYAATSKILLRPIAGNALNADSAKNAQQVTVAMQTEAELVTSPAVRELAAKKVAPSVDLGEGSLSASVPPNTEIVQVKFSARTPEAATRGAQAFAESFLSYRAGQATSTQARQLDILQKQASTAEDNLRKASQEASGANPLPEANAQVQLYTNRLAGLQDNISVLQTTATDAGAVVSPASAGRAAGLPPWLLPLLGLLVGAFMGSGIALWRARMDDRIRLDSDVAAGGVPALAFLPTGGGHHDRHVELANAFRTLRTSLAAALPPPSVIVISPMEPTHQREAAHVAYEVARTLSRAAYRVRLVDATLGVGRLHEPVGVPASSGLSEALANVTGRVHLTPAGEIELLSAGMRAEESTELLGGDRLAKVLARLRKGADFIIVAAPLAHTAEGEAVALCGDGWLTVAVDGRTTHEAMREVHDKAARLDINLVGFVAVSRKHPQTSPSTARSSEAPRPAAASGEVPAEAEDHRTDQVDDVDAELASFQSAARAAHESRS